MSNETTVSKTCSRCEAVDPLCGFPTQKVNGKVYSLSYCCECRNAAVRERHRKWREENPDKVKASHKKHYETNRPERMQQSKDWSANNREKVNERQRARKKERRATMTSEEKAKLSAENKAWKDANRDRVNEANRNWVKNNPEKRRESLAKSQAKRQAAEGAFTQQEFEELCARYGSRCLCCGESKPLSPDHVIPLSRGGTNYISNIQPLCHKCNLRKGTATTDYRPKG